jgi:hypothetical protein
MPHGALARDLQRILAPTAAIRHNNPAASQSCLL